MYFVQRRLFVSNSWFFYYLDTILISLIIWFIFPMERKLERKEDNATGIRCNHCCTVKELIIKEETGGNNIRSQNKDITHITKSTESWWHLNERAITLCTLIAPQAAAAFQSIFFRSSFHSPPSLNSSCANLSSPFPP